MGNTLRLSHTEEIELARVLRDNDEGSRRYRRALDKMVICNLGLVNKIANKFPVRTASCSFDDLFQEGVAGLIHGIRKFDPSLGYRLSTYVYRWISVYVTRFYQNHARVIRLPIHISEKRYRLSSQIKELTEKLGRTPTLDEIHQVNNKSDQILESTMGISSLDYCDQQSDNFSLYNVVGEDKTEEFECRYDCETLLERVRPLVSNRDFHILVKRYGLDGDTPLTLSEVADRHSITRARVHQIEHKILKKMKELAVS